MNGSNPADVSGWEAVADREPMRSLLPEAFAFLRRLVEVNSFTGNRDGLQRNADLIESQFASLGFTGERVPAENPAFGEHLFLHRSGTDPVGVLLVSHLDTVYPPEEEEKNDFRWLEEAGRIFGPGVNDIKGGTALMWLVLAALRETAPAFFARTHWLVALNAAEEELAADFPVLCREKRPPGCRAALIFEASGGQGKGLSLVKCRKGSANLRIWVEGRGAHAGSRHHEGANAIAALARVVLQIEALTDPARQLTVNVGNISGGGPSNRVPHHAECAVNLRAFDPEVLDGAVQAIHALAEAPPAVRAVSDGFPCRVFVESCGQNPAWPPSAETDALIDCWIEAAQAEGLVLRAEPRGGLSDGNRISQFLPTLDGLGPFGLNGHASERSADGSKLPEFAVKASFGAMAAVTLRALKTLIAESK